MNNTQATKVASKTPLTVNDFATDDLTHEFNQSAYYFLKHDDCIGFDNEQDKQDWINYDKKNNLDKGLNTYYWNDTDIMPVFFNNKHQIIKISDEQSFLVNNKDGEFTIKHNGKLYSGYVLLGKETKVFYPVNYKGLHGYIAQANQWP